MDLERSNTQGNRFSNLWRDSIRDAVLCDFKKKKTSSTAAAATCGECLNVPGACTSAVEGEPSSVAASADIDLSTPQNIETDNIFVDGCPISVGNIIKSAALRIHNRLIHEPSFEMTDRERKLMT